MNGQWPRKAGRCGLAMSDLLGGTEVLRGVPSSAEALELEFMEMAKKPPVVVVVVGSTVKVPASVSEVWLELGVT